LFYLFSSVLVVIVFSILGSILKLYEKKLMFFFTFFVKMDTDPDPAKLGHRIHNTAKKYIILSIFPGGPVAKAGAF
jgi:hypothetical protein